MKPITVTHGVFLAWAGFDHFTIEVQTPSDEARRDLLDAMRDRKKLKVTIEVGE